MYIRPLSHRLQPNYFTTSSNGIEGPGGATCGFNHSKALSQALDEGLAANGWVEDQRWTLARVTRLVFE
jgi:hypothetical protein